MEITPLDNALPGEWAAAVSPEPAPAVAGGWRRRLRLYTGRALTAPALIREQQGRAGRLALRGRLVSPGVARGLEVGVERGANGLDSRLHLAPGVGLTPEGEDVTVALPIRVRVGDLPVVAQSAFLADGVLRDALGDALPSAPGPLADRSVTPTLEDAPNRDALPRVAVLVLQPVIADRVGGADPDDPCARDPEAEAYEDWQIVDGCRLLLYAWPTEWLPLPPEGEQRRNLLAYTVFEAERFLPRGGVLPWGEWGVPVALIGFADDWTPLYADRSAVARAGGRAHTRPLTLPRAELEDSLPPTPPAPEPALREFRPQPGGPFLWQARVRQFAEQLTDVLQPPDGSAPPALTPALFAERFRFLPPIGFLPRDAVSADFARLGLLPDDYAADAVPVPTEQLELLLEAAAPLAPFDLTQPDRIRVAVPVPQAFFEPRLLQTERPDPEFDEAIAEFTARRAVLLLRRDDVRAKADALARARTGRPLAIPEESLLEDEQPAEVLPGGAEPELDYGTEEREGARVSRRLNELLTQLRADTPLGKAAVSLPALPNGLLEGFDGRLRYDAAQQTLTAVGPLADADRDTLVNRLQNDTDRNALRLLYDLSRRELAARLTELGLEPFITELERLIRRADEVIDLGFVKFQTDTYRIRQLVLDNEAATKLAVSPTLATIAKGQTAVATQENVTAFYNRIRAASLDPPPRPDPAQPIAAPVPPAGGVGGVAGGIRGGAFRIAAQPGGADFTTDAARTFARGGLASGAARATGSVFGGRRERLIEIDSPLGGGLFGGGRGVSDLENIGVIESGFGGARGEVTAVERIGVVSVNPALNRNLFVEAQPGLLFGTALANRAIESVQAQSPIVGKSYGLRTTSIAERFTAPRAPEARNYAAATKHDVVRSLTELADAGLNLSGVSVPGVARVRVENGREVYETDAQGRVLRESLPLLAFRTRPELLGRILNEPSPETADEAALFGAGVDASDSLVAALNMMEGRVEAYRQALALCRAALDDLKRDGEAAARRLDALSAELAEARHDVAVGRMLLADETRRVDALNARRRQILAEHVPFLAFFRPRLLDLTDTLPARILNPAPTSEPFPACLAREVETPKELRAFVDLFRESPVAWFTSIPRLLDRLDRVEVLQEVVVKARVRAQSQVQTAKIGKAFEAASGLHGAAIARLYTAQSQAVGARRLLTAQVDLGAAARLSWAGLRDGARDALSLGDLLDGDHGRGDVSQSAAKELENIARVAGCLYEGFGAVLPVVRLEWAERLSQYDAPVPLRNLAALPGWNEIGFSERREMQGLVDWLFGRIDANQAGAVALMNDLVRLCVLLASHAPVNQIIAGRLPRPTTVQPGGRVTLTAEPGRVRAGMHVLMYAGAEVVARAVVEDLQGGEVAARVTQVLRAGASSVRLEAEARVQFVRPESAVVSASVAASVRVTGRRPVR